MVGFIKSALNALGLKGKDGGANISLEEFLNEMPRSMGFDVSFKKVDSEEKGLHFEVQGDEVDSFVGDSSDMLDALAHISMRVLRRSEGLANAPSEEGQEGLRVVFDSQGFRERKRTELQELAASQRQKVIETGGKPAYIPALGPSERKIIHTYLADLGEVVSESIGRGNFKRIRLRLKEDSPHRRAPEPRAEGEGQSQPQGQQAQGRGNGGGGNRSRGPRGNGGGGGRSRGPRGNGGGRSQQRQGGGGNRYSEPGNEFNTTEPVIDDNIGNRLRPGEEPVFKYSGPNLDSDGYDDDYNKN